MKIIITGSWTSKNKGDAGIMKTLLSCIKKVNSDCTISIISNDPKNDKERYYPVECLAAPLSIRLKRNKKSLTDKLFFNRLTIRMWDYASIIFQTFKYWIVSVFHRFSLPMQILINKKESVLFQRYLEADCVIAVGGGYLRETGLRGFMFHFLQLLIPLWLGKPIGVYASSIGPFKNNFKMKLAAYILNRADFILLREQKSLEFCNEIGISQEKVKVTIDAAYGLNPSPEFKIDSLLSNYHVREKRHPFVGMTVHNWKFPNISSKEANEKSIIYFEAITKLIKHITTDLNGTVIFIPQNVEENIDRNVIHVAKFVTQKIGESQNIIIIDKEYSPEEIKGIYGKMDFSVVSHMHGLIYSTSQLIPTMTFAYEPKFEGLMKFLKLESFNLNMYDMDVDDAVNTFDNLLKHKEEVIEILINANEEIEKQLQINDNILENFLKSYA